MSKTNTTIVKCPTCQKKVAWSSDNDYRPFCSQRCQLIDLGAWSSEEYRIPEQQPQELWSESGSADLTRKPLN